MRILTVCLTILIITGCSAKKTTNSKSHSIVFSGGKWVMKEIAGVEIDPVKAGKEMPFVDFNLTQQNMSAFAGCNRLNVAFNLNSDTITFSQMISTKMACPDMQYEYALERLLVPGKYTYKEDGNILVLFFNSSKVIEFVRPEPLQNK